VSSPPALRKKPSHSFFVLVVDEDARGGALWILELPAAQRPEEGRQAGQAKAEGDRDQEQQAVHRAERISRSELATTMSELPDMATAAISGVTSPAMASGTAITL